MCDLIITSIYDAYQEYLSDLSIGYPISGKRNRKIEDLIHVYHLLVNSELTNDEVLSILNYYHEY